MKKCIKSLAILCLSFLWSCGSEDVTTWTVSNLTPIGENECDLGNFTGQYEITIDGNTLSFEVLEGDGFSASTDSFQEQDNEVVVIGETLDDRDPPCIAKLSNVYTITVEDESLRLENNETLQVTWEHSEDDISDNTEECQGDWFFVPLPCTSSFTFTLTQE